MTIRNPLWWLVGIALVAAIVVGGIWKGSEIANWATNSYHSVVSARSAPAPKATAIPAPKLAAQAPQAMANTTPVATPTSAPTAIPPTVTLVPTMTPVPSTPTAVPPSATPTSSPTVVILATSPMTIPKSVLTATPGPTATPDQVDKLSTMVAVLSAKLDAVASGITVTKPITLSASSGVTMTGGITKTSGITPTVVVTQGNWTITYYSGATAEMRAWKFQDLNPKAWAKFPNVNNTIGSNVYPAAQGLEYGQDKDFACEGVGCFMIVSAQHYRIWSGDGGVPELGYQCVSKDGSGCGLMVVNVGSVTTEWEAILKRGFTIRGRYWDGKYLYQAIWAGLSHTAFNMLNLSSDSTNAGSNCSSPDGCRGVDFTFYVTSGKEVLMKGTTFVAR